MDSLAQAHQASSLINQALVANGASRGRSANQGGSLQVSTFGPRDLNSGSLIAPQPDLSPAQFIFLQTRQSSYSTLLEALNGQQPGGMFPIPQPGGMLPNPQPGTFPTPQPGGMFPIAQPGGMFPVPQPGTFPTPQSGGMPQSQLALQAALLQQRMAAGESLNLQQPMTPELIMERMTTAQAQYGHDQASANIQSLTNGVADGRINQQEFQALMRHQSKTETMRAHMREDGYSPEEIAFLEQRSEQYRNLEQAFLSGDHTPANSDPANPIEGALQQFYDDFSSGQISAEQFQAKLQYTTDAAYGQGTEIRGGVTYQDERGKRRAMDFVQRGIDPSHQSQQPARPPRPDVEVTPEHLQRAESLLDGLRGNFRELDDNGNGRISHAELRSIIADPDKFGLTPQEAAIVFTRQSQISSIDQTDSPPIPGVPQISPNDLTERDLVSGDQVNFFQQPQRDQVINSLARDLAESPTEAKPSRGLFGPEGRPDPSSIRQNQEGSCWLLSSLGTLKPEEISKLIQETDDGNYVVRFPGAEEPETISPLTEAERLVYSNSNGDWSALIEKAAAQHYARDGRDIDGTPDLGQGINLLTGADTTSYQLNQAPMSPEQPDTRDSSVVGQILEQSVGNGHQVIAGTVSHDFDSVTSRISTSNHAYAVVGYDAESQTVTLRNPWGQNEKADYDDQNDGLFEMPLSVFHDNFSEFSVQNPTPG